MRAITAAFYLIILSIALLNPITAAAQSSNTCGTTNDGCNEGRAYNQCLAGVAYTMTLSAGSVVYENCTKSGFSFTCGVRPKDSTANMCRNASGTPQASYVFVRSCIAMESLPPGLIVFSGFDKSEICAGGCKFKRGDAPSDNYDIEGFASTIGTVGGWTPTGATCKDEEPPPKPDQQCVPASAGQTMCVKPNGEKCATASNGKTFCWGKGDTSDKKDGNQYGTNGDGTPKPPAPEPKPADNSDWKPPQNCTTVNERSGNGYTGRTHVICTGTSTGTPNPAACNPSTDPNCRRPSDNNTGCDPKTDPKQCQGGTASGGQGCDSPPSCSGDPIGCAILGQGWRQRCSPNGNKAQGGECTAQGGVADFTCSGDEILCKSARTALEQKCRAKKSDDDLASDAGNGIDDSEEPDGVFIDEGDTPSFDRGLVSLGGGTLIPAVSIMGTAWTLPPEFYNLLAVIRLIVIAACSIYAMRVVFS